MSNAGCRTTARTTRKTRLNAPRTAANSTRYRAARRRRALANTLGRSLRVRAQTVTCTSDGLDQPIAAPMVDLASKASDVDLDDIGLGGEVGIPDGIDEAPLVEDLAEVTCEDFEEREL